MSDFKKNISERLSKIDKDRYWLAEQLGRKKPTVDGWFSKKVEISEIVKSSMLSKIEEEERRQLAGRDGREQWKTYSVMFNKNTEYPDITRAADISGLTVQEWSERELMRAAEDMQFRVKDREYDANGRNVAEDTPPYGGNQDGENRGTK